MIQKLISPEIEIKSHYENSQKIILNNGDTLKFLDEIPEKSIQLIITSPPYNIGKKYERKVSIENYLETQEVIIKKLIEKLNDRGSICWQVGNYVENGEIFPLDIFYYQIFKRFELKLRNRIIWRFNHGLHCSKRLSGRYETILWYTKSNNYTFNLDSIRVPAKYPGKRHFKGPKKGQPSGNPLGKNPSDVWEILETDWDNEFWDIPNVKSNHPEKSIHPCQFPIELVERCVLALSNENDYVFDPFCGVGSTIIAAIKNNRKGIGVDKEKEYIEIAKERIKKYYNGELKIRPIGKPIHVPTGKEKVSKIPSEWKDKEALFL